MIRYTIVDDTETCATFAEPVRTALADLDERIRIEINGTDPSQDLARLGQVRDRVGALDPARLEPRRGFAGLFDSRSRRLNAFRTAYAASATEAGEAATGLRERATAIAGRDETLQALWTRTREAITELDAHLAAARVWLAEREPTPPSAQPTSHPDPEPVADDAPPATLDAIETYDPGDAPDPEISTSDAVPAEPPPLMTSDQGIHEEPPTAESGGEAVAEAPQPGPDPETHEELLPVATLPHPLESRLEVLTALRAAAMGHLPRLRTAQNADCRLPAALASAGEGIETWRTDWQEALGLTGRKPKRVRPDLARLTQGQTALSDRLVAAERELGAARDRRAELEARAATALASLAT